MLLKDDFIDDQDSLRPVVDDGHVSGLIDREYERLVAKENIFGDRSAADDHSILNFFAGRSGAERRRHEAVAQHGAIAYWRQTRKSSDQMLNEPALSPCRAPQQSPMQQVVANDQGATVYNYRRKKNATFTKLLAQALNT